MKWNFEKNQKKALIIIPKIPILISFIHFVNNVITIVKANKRINSD